MIEFSERMSYFGLSTNLIIYLTKVLHEDLKTAVKNVNNWIGVTTLMPLIGGFVADGYLGRFSTVLVSTLFYLVVCFLWAINYVHLFCLFFKINRLILLRAFSLI